MKAESNRDKKYQAILKKDKKYDGIFYFVVKTTNIYCRPSCSTSTPPRKDCSFFDGIEELEREGYQPCKVCHPDRLRNDLSLEILDNIEAGAISEKGVQGLADSLHISERHMRRLVQARTGTSPLRLNRAKRLEAAKVLVTQTKLPIVDVAFSAEFSSLRQFNDVFKQAFKVSPSEMRKTVSMRSTLLRI